jgi:arylsulfatase A
MLATIADVIGEKLPSGTGEDSFTMLPALLGKSMDQRPAIIHHSNSAYAMRDGKWKILFGQGEGRVQPKEGHGYLFDLEADPYETNDLWSERPAIVTHLTQKFIEIKTHGNYH